MAVRLVEYADVFGPAELPRRGRSEKSKQAEKIRLSKLVVNPRDKIMIAWDGEGMKIDGDNKPQRYVLYGCSADRANPCIISSADGDLDFIRIVEYTVSIAQRFPNAYHIGYFFGYDQNMIIKSLPPMAKLALYEKNRVRVNRNGCEYIVQWTPKKRIRLTKVDQQGKRLSLVIDDMAAFFAKSFVKAYSELFPEDIDTPEFQRVIEGKSNRADMLYKDMPEVLAYWQDEIECLRKLAERFRGIMYDAGFELREWYGPGALANLIRRMRGLATHEWGGKEANLPDDVHVGSKIAYFGGHFEQYQAGRIAGPVYVYDINSAYPAAIAKLPSLRDGGEWHKVSTPTRGIRVGVYRCQYGDRRSPIAWRPQPLPHRDFKGETSYPSRVAGWYWTPEAAMAKRLYKAEVLDGWEWWPVDPSERPWAFLEDMYQQRLVLKNAGNPCERAFKLGPNSLYGKLAQNKGWNKIDNTPPRAHTLPLAGWVTAWCRAEIMKVVARMDPTKVIAVETDGVFSLQPPEEINVTTSKDLGGWGVTIYDEIVYVQNGLYVARQGNQWYVKSRGMDASAITYDGVMAYLSTLKAGGRACKVEACDCDGWHAIEVAQSERFIGIGAAISRSMQKNGAINPFKMNKIHCRWEQSPRHMAPGFKGKRVHIPESCPACLAGLSAAEGAHRLHVRSQALQHPESYPYQLPWEKGYEKPEWAKMDEIADHELSLEQM